MFDAGAAALSSPAAIDEDARPLLAFARGDATAFDRLYARHERPVYGFLLRSEAFLLHAEADLTVEEVARPTGVGAETAKSRLRYALAKLRAALEDRQ